MAPAQYIAGRFYGVEGEDKRDYILDCYKTVDDLTDTLYDGMEAYIKGDVATGEAKMKETPSMFDEALEKCVEVHGKI